MIDDHWDALSQAQVSTLFGVTGPAVRKWEVEQGCPRNKNGSYDLPQVIAWWKGQYEERIKLAESNVKSIWVEKKREYDAKLKELDLNERKRELIPAAEVRRDVGLIVEQFKRNLLGQPTKLAATFASLDRPEDCQAELEREHRELLDDLRRGLMEFIDEEETATQNTNRRD